MGTAAAALRKGRSARPVSEAERLARGLALRSLGLDSEPENDDSSDQEGTR